MRGLLVGGDMEGFSTPSPSKSPTSSGLQVAMLGWSVSTLAPPTLDKGGSVTTSNPAPNCFCTSACKSASGICSVAAEMVGPLAGAGLAVVGVCPQTRKPDRMQETNKTRAKLELHI